LGRGRVGTRGGNALSVVGIVNLSDSVHRGASFVGPFTYRSARGSPDRLRVTHSP
jgi:hypothetical protein